MAQIYRKGIRRRVHSRIRRKISGTAERPRLSVHFSNRHAYAQLIDDVAGRTLASASTRDAEINQHAASVETATKVGELIARRASEKEIKSVVFDRGGFVFHGKVKALADAARNGGLEF